MADDGERVRREVLGDEHVDRTLGGASEYAAPFQEYLTRVAWGEVWARPASTAARARASRSRC